MKAIRLELPSGNVRPISETRIHAVSKLSDRLRAIGSGIDGVPLQLQDELGRRMEALFSKQITFHEAIDSPALARAFVVSYRAHLSFRREVPFTSEVVHDLITLLANRPAPLVTVYLEYFDQLEARRDLGAYLLNYYAQLDKNRRLGPADERYRRFSSILFAENGPQVFADNATRAEGGVANLSQQAGVPNVGEFHDTVWRYFYVAHADAVTMGDVSSTLQQAVQSGAHEEPLEHRLVGHLLVEALVARCIRENRPVPDRWLSYLLRVAGDPRKSPMSAAFQKWWAPQEASIVRKVKASLAKRDLKFFLELLEEFSFQTGGALARMYPARKQFLEGFLAEGDRVQDALLILSESGMQFIREKLPIEEEENSHRLFARVETIRIKAPSIWSFPTVM